MNPRSLCQLAARLMRHATAPYHEHAVRAEAKRICAEHALPFEQDQFGNIVVRLRTAPKSRPLVLAAHLDHPGFEVLRRISGQRYLARFRGGVPNTYFKPGLALQLMPGGVRAKLGRQKGQPQDKLFELHAAAALANPPKFAVWEMTDFSVRRQQIHGRACDDLIGVASALAVLIELKRRRARVHVLAVLSRAEEVGFHGAMALAAARGVPANSLVLSLETSRELPGVHIGAGVILRVGDRTSIFNSEATRFLGAISAELKAKGAGFEFQRALMPGGTCEATAYQEFGLQSAAVCVALGNYHNCGERNRIEAEYVSVTDVCRMVDLLVAAAKGMPRYPRLVAKLPRDLQQKLRAARGPLMRSAQDPD